VFWFPLQNLSEILFFLRRIVRDMIKKVYCLHVKYLLFLSDFSENWFFWADFQTSIKRKPSFSVRTDARTDITKLTVAFRNFANSPKNVLELTRSWTFIKWEFFPLYLSLIHMNENGLFFVFSVNCSFVYSNTFAFWSVDKNMLKRSLAPHSPGLVLTVNL
jgi:hypothetical protein